MRENLGQNNSEYGHFLGSGLLVEYLVADQLTYLEQMYTKLLNHADFASCWYQQYYNELIPLH